MAHHYSDNGTGRKPSDGSEHTIVDFHHWRDYSFRDRPRKRMQTKIIAWITFDVLGGIFVVSNALARINSYIDFAILCILFLYVCARSYIRLKRDMVALKKEQFEQMLREKEYYEE